MWPKGKRQNNKVGTVVVDLGVMKESPPTTLRLPLFQQSELVLGEQDIWLGSSTVVRELLQVQLAHDEEESERGQLARTVSHRLSHISQSDHRHRMEQDSVCLVKMLRENLSDSQHVAASMDLEKEASLLRSLQHPNIIKLCGLHADHDDECVGHSYIPNNFVVMERFFETMSDRIRYDWIEKHILALASNQPIPGMPTALWTDETDNYLESRLFFERLTIAKNLASALQYLHEHGVVYRDLKPENIAFDNDGVVKLVDFTMAQRLDPKRQCEGDDGEVLYRLTARCGTFPYMAPEVAMKLPYNETCDVFAFGMLLWEMLALECPFPGIKSRRDFYFHISIGGERPTVPQSWPRGTRALLEACWNAVPAERPSCSRIGETLQSDLTELLPQTQKPTPNNDPSWQWSTEPMHAY